MARVKGALNARKKHKRILTLAKGFYGARSKQYKSAKAAVMHSMADSYVGRRQKKRDFRRLWIARINAACHLNDISYSRFMNGLKKADIALDRKVLSDIAITDPKGFAALCEQAKSAL